MVSGVFILMLAWFAVCRLSWWFCCGGDWETVRLEARRESTCASRPALLLPGVESRGLELMRRKCALCHGEVHVWEAVVSMGSAPRWDDRISWVRVAFAGILMSVGALCRPRSPKARS